MSTIASLPRASVALLFTASTALAAGTHCAPAERVVFSCSLARAKVVSLCLSPASATAPASLVYRFGALGKPELVFPSTAAGSLQQFRYAHYFRYQVDRTQLSFTSNGVEYSVQDFYDGLEKQKHQRGVSVTIGDKDHDFPCVAGVVSRLPELEKIVPCDTDSALASCR